MRENKYSTANMLTIAFILFIFLANILSLVLEPVIAERIVRAHGVTGPLVADVSYGGGRSSIDWVSVHRPGMAGPHIFFEIHFGLFYEIKRPNYKALQDTKPLPQIKIP